ncbi:MAG: Fic family protein [Eubacteriales bacterium]|nr:Fic family protein [Eubacteriales bacterium]
MEAKLFAKMISDPHLSDLKKMKYKYSTQAVDEMISLMRSSIYKTLDIDDFNGISLVYRDTKAGIHIDSVKQMLNPAKFGEVNFKVMEDEIFSTLAIENIESNRESIRRILRGYAPADETELRIYGIKRGIDFVSSPGNLITQENLNRLYRLAVEDALDESDLLLPGEYYRHDTVYVVGINQISSGVVEHSGLPAEQLKQYMEKLVRFINAGDGMNELLKACVIHFYLAFLHPWFDGNGRMARLLMLWYLVQKGLPGSLYIPLSVYVDQSRKHYYEAFSLIEQNAKISGLIDVTPFLDYFVTHVYNKLTSSSESEELDKRYTEMLAEGHVTTKEAQLWRFVQDTYGRSEFSTKRLERDHGAAAYATIRSFVMKFHKAGLLQAQTYSNRVRYKICN